MALTIVKNTKARGMIDLTLNGNKHMKMVPLTITFDSSYPTGGEAFSFSGINSIMVMLIEGSGNYRLQYDYTNDKILAYVGSTGAEVANATDLSAVTVQAILLGY